MSGNVRFTAGQENKDFRYTTSADRGTNGEYYVTEKRQTIAPGSIGVASNHAGANYIKTSDGRLIPVQSGITYQSGYRTGSGDISGAHHVSGNYQQIPASSYRQTSTRQVYVDGQPGRDTSYHYSRNTGGISSGAVAGGAISGGAVAGGAYETSARGVSGGNISQEGYYQGQQRRTYGTQEREVERPQYKKLYSNNDGRVEGTKYGTDGRVSGDAGLNGKKKSKCCHPALLALLGCLALAGIILGILFGTGVLGGGGSGEEKTAANGVMIDGVQYPANTISRKTVLIENQAEDGVTPVQTNPSSKTAIAGGVAGGAIAGGVVSKLIQRDSNGNQYYTKDGQKYPVITNEDHKIVNINGQDNLILNDQLYPIYTKDEATYANVDGKEIEIPESQFRIGVDENGNKVAIVQGKSYPIHQRHGVHYFDLDGKQYLLFRGQPVETNDQGIFSYNGFDYKYGHQGNLQVNVDGQWRPAYTNNNLQFAKIDGQKYLLIEQQKYKVQQDENGQLYANVNGERAYFGPKKRIEQGTQLNGFTFFVDPLDNKKKVIVDDKQYQFAEKDGKIYIRKQDGLLYILKDGKAEKVQTQQVSPTYVDPVVVKPQSQ